MKYIGPFDRGKRGKSVDMRFEPEFKKKKKKILIKNIEFWEIDKCI